MLIAVLVLVRLTKRRVQLSRPSKTELSAGLCGLCKQQDYNRILPKVQALLNKKGVRG